MSFSNVRPLRSRLAQDSITDFREFANDLNEALAKSVPTNLARYKHAAALSLTWSNDDIGVMPQTDQFLSILKTVYNYATEKFILNAAKPLHELQRDLTDRIMAFTKEHEAKTPNDDHLLIYYYSGHGETGPGQNQLRLSGRLQPNGRLATPWLDWYQYGQLALQYPRADTFMLLDCCKSAMAAIQGHSEILAASGWETTTPSSLHDSFTRFVIDEFTAANGRAFTVAQMHARLMGNAIIRNMSATPFHVAHPDNRPSVLFHKILGRDARNVQLMPQEIAGKVVIKVSVLGRGNVPNAAQWAQWLTTNMPPDLQDIEILKKYESTSVSVLVAVPVALWNYLEARPGYQYVDRYWGPFPPKVRQASVGQAGSSQQQQVGLTFRAGNIPRPTDIKQGSPAPGSSKGKENIR